MPARSYETAKGYIQLLVFSTRFTVREIKNRLRMWRDVDTPNKETPPLMGRPRRHPTTSDLDETLALQKADRDIIIRGLDKRDEDLDKEFDREVLDSRKCSLGCRTEALERVQCGAHSSLLDEDRTPWW